MNAPTSATAAGAAAVKSDSPYPHFCIQKMFADEEADALHDWIASDRTWRFRETSFYAQNSVDICVGTEICAEGLDLGLDLRERVMTIAAEVFGIRFRHERFEAHAHKFEIGQGIGIHNDWPIGGTESHRIVVHLNKDYDDSQGGHLLLYGSENLHDIRAVYRPIHNMAIAFPLGRGSWHSVANVRTGRRYSIVFSLWEENHKADDCDAESWRKNCTILVDAGARQVDHSGRSLFEHLVGVAETLDEWGCDLRTVNVGLFHSVFGTPSFRPDGLAKLDLETLEAVVGRAATLLVAAYPRRSLAHLACLAAPDADEVALIHVQWANIIDQSRYVPIEDEDLAIRRQEYAATAQWLKDDASNAVAKLLGAPVGSAT